MAARVNYEDDIFFLAAIIKALSTGIALEVDREYFHEKIIEDVAFIHSTITRLHISLKDNVYLIRRSDYIRELTRTVAAFRDFLDIIARGETRIAADLCETADTFARYRREQVTMLGELNRILRSEDARTAEEEDIVGQNEYRFLFEEEGEE